MNLNIFVQKYIHICGLRLLSSNVSNWRSTIGLEIHAQISSRSKLFSSAETKFASPINSNVNLFDAAIPGTLPALNKNCVVLAVQASLALSCEVHEMSLFDRKHYFYADLPSGYQITQQRSPIATKGCLDFQVFTPGIHNSPYKKSCRIKQIQLEQDSGKSLHDLNSNKSLIDLNRAGMGLIEFVFEPDLSDGEEAAALVKELILILERLNTSSCKMEEGALRVDANVSVSNDRSKLGVRTEIKNIGSVRAVANAVKYECDRQISVLTKGGSIINETRSWDPNRKETVPMRDKEEKQDYRFMPEPNLPPLRICLDDSVAVVPRGTLDLRHTRKSIPELPEASRMYLTETYAFSDVYAIMIVNRPKLFDYFKVLMAENSQRNAKTVWNVLVVQLLSVIYENEIELNDCDLETLELGNAIDLHEVGSISLETVNDILRLRLKGCKSTAIEIVEQNKWHLISDLNRIDTICSEVISRNPKAVKKYLKGKKKALQTVINDVSNVTSEKINLSLVSKRLKEILSIQESSQKTTEK